MSDVGKSSLLIASGTVVSRGLGFAKSLMLAATIGQTGSTAAAAFGLANQLPNNVYALVAGGVMSAVLVPHIVKASRGADRGEAYISKLLTLGGTVFLLITIVATLMTPLIVNLYVTPEDASGGGFTAAQLELAYSLAYWCMPQIFFYAVYTLLGEIYNARKQFGPYTWAPVINNIVSIAGMGIFLLLFGEANTNKDASIWGIDRIALMGIVTTAGIAAQAVVLILFFPKTGLKFRLDFGWRGVGLRATGKQAMWLLGIVIIGQIKGLFQSRVATMAGPDDANLFTMQQAWYIFSLPHSIIAVSIAIAFFTRMSEHAHDKNIPALRADLSSALRSVGMLTTLAAIAISVVAIPLGRLFEQSGAGSVQMAIVIWAMLVCAVAYSAEYVIQRVFFALDDTRTAFIYVCFGAILTLGLLWGCSLLPPQWIIAGVASAVSIANLVSVTAWLILVRRKIGSYGFTLVARRHVQYLLYALIAAIPGAAIVWALGGFSESGWATATKMHGLVTCIAGGAPIALVYFGLLFVTKNPDFRATTDLLLAKIGRRPSRTP